MSRLTGNGKEFKEKNPEQFEKMIKAMEMSNGKVDNLLGVLLAASDTTTAEDIVKLASGFENDEDVKNKFEPIVGYQYRTKFWEVEHGRTKDEIMYNRKNLREKKFRDGFRYTFKDTYLYRAMEKIGMTTKLEGERSWGGELSTYNVDEKNSYSKKLSDSKYVNSLIMYYHSSEDLRNIIINDEVLNEMWTEQAKIQRNIYKPYSDEERELHPITSTEDEWRKFQIKYIIQEFDQLAHMPLDVKEKMNKWVEYYKNPEHSRSYGQEKLPPIVMHTILEGFRYPAEDKNMELIEEAYGVMEYMGIGVCWNFVDSEQYETNPDGSIKYGDDGKPVYKYVFRRAGYKEMSYKVGAMLKHVSSNMRKFAADIKKGFDVKDVRELIIEDLNGWSTAQARGHWQFFERDDAPKEYPDLAKKKKAKKTATENLELNETELKVVEMFRKGQQNNG